MPIASPRLSTVASARTAQAQADWWPRALNLDILHQHDTRTDPMHGRKMCAAVQHATTGDRPILLRTEGDVGHGARSMSKSVEETADTLAFFEHWTRA